MKQSARRGVSRNSAGKRFGSAAPAASQEAADFRKRTAPAKTRQAPGGGRTSVCRKADRARRAPTAHVRRREPGRPKERKRRRRNALKGRSGSENRKKAKRTQTKTGPEGKSR